MTKRNTVSRNHTHTNDDFFPEPRTKSESLLPFSLVDTHNREIRKHGISTHCGYIQGGDATAGEHTEFYLRATISALIVAHTHIQTSPDKGKLHIYSCHMCDDEGIARGARSS